MDLVDSTHGSYCTVKVKHHAITICKTHFGKEGDCAGHETCNKYKLLLKVLLGRLKEHLSFLSMKVSFDDCSNLQKHPKATLCNCGQKGMKQSETECSSNKWI